MARPTSNAHTEKMCTSWLNDQVCVFSNVRKDFVEKAGLDPDAKIDEREVRRIITSYVDPKVPPKEVDRLIGALVMDCYMDQGQGVNTIRCGVLTTSILGAVQYLDSLRGKSKAMITISKNRKLSASELFAPRSLAQTMAALPTFCLLDPVVQMTVPGTRAAPAPWE